MTIRMPDREGIQDARRPAARPKGYVVKDNQLSLEES